MELAEIEENVACIEAGPGPEFVYALLAAYGLPKNSITRLRSGSYDKSETAEEVLWKDKVYFRFADVADEELLRIIDAAERRSGDHAAQAAVSDRPKRRSGSSRETSAWRRHSMSQPTA